MNLAPSETPQSTLPPRRPRLWLLAIPLALALFFVLRRPPAPIETQPATEPTPQTSPTARSAVTKPTAPSSTTKPKPIQLILFVPDDNGRLQRKMAASNLPPLQPDKLDAKMRDVVQAKVATLALERMMQQAPTDFPSGAKMRAPIVLKDGVARIDFNANFADPNFWQGETRVLASTQAIAHTVSGTLKAVGATQNNGVQLLVEGKPLEVLGELEVSEPIVPDAKMVSGG